MKDRNPLDDMPAIADVVHVCGRSAELDHLRAQVAELDAKLSRELIENHRLAELVKAADEVHRKDALVHIRLRDGLRRALAIAWRRGRNEFPPTDSCELAELQKLVQP